MRARANGSAWEILAPAKLNLYLEVLGRRSDGFHELDTLMTPVRLFDRLSWAPASPGAESTFSLAYDASTDPAFQQSAPPDHDNLVWRAFDLLGRTAGIQPHGQATLVKRIPIQAGLGGASSDAAAALVLANEAWGVNYPRARLAELAASLGSDVPFFLAGGPAICRGRGERVEPVSGLPPLHVVIAKPAMGVSTPDAFAALDAGPVTSLAAQDSQSRVAQLVDNLRSGMAVQAARRIVNRLETVAARLCPSIARVLRVLDDCAALGRAMSGSGSACFALMRSARQARCVAQRLAAYAGPASACRENQCETGILGSVYATTTFRSASPP